MNSKQRRMHRKRIEALYGAELNQKLATARLLGESYISLGHGMPMPDTWPVAFVQKERYAILMAIDRRNP